jgi:hypothetical protein
VFFRSVFNILRSAFRCAFAYFFWAFCCFLFAFREACDSGIERPLVEAELAKQPTHNAPTRIKEASRFISIGRGTIL